MNLKTKLAASILMLGSASMAQAVTYDVAANFSDGGMQNQTLFNGSFNFDVATNTVTSFSGLLSEAMWGWNSTRMGGMFDSNGTDIGGMGGDMSSFGGMNGQTDVYNPSGTFSMYGDNDAPLIMLGGASTRVVSTYDAGTGMVTAQAFLRDNDTDVFSQGGTSFAEFVVDNNNIGSNKYFDGSGVANNNAFFEISFAANNVANASELGMNYGDCTALGLMSGMLTGSLCMSGGVNLGAGGSMAGFPSTLAISEVSAVPVPAAAWLFGGALMSLFGANRRKNVLPA